MKQCTCYALRAIDCTCKPAKYGELYTSPTAKQEQGEPVAYIRDEENICYQYTSLQPNRSPLTKDQLNVLWKDANKEYGGVIWRFARAIEAAHGIKE
jgi:hypothetical protein